MSLQVYMKRKTNLGQYAINIRREIELESESQSWEQDVFAVDYPEWAKDVIR